MVCAIAALHHPVGAALENTQLANFGRDHRDELNRARSVADHRDIAPGQIDIVTPSRGMKRHAFEILEAFDLRNRRTVELPDSAHQHVGDDRFASRSLETPNVLVRIPMRARDFGVEADVPREVVLACATLHVLENFKGVSFHSARWRHDVDLTGRNVAVIGNAASAIQFIPVIAPKVRKLNIFQRSANWMVERGDRAYTEAEKERCTRHRTLALAYRWLIYFQHEINWPIFRRVKFFVERTQKMCEQYRRSTLKDPKLQESQLPDYPFGGKRMLISDDYFPALNRENVEVVLGGIDRVAENAIVTKDGRTIPADVIVLATGFQSTSFLAPMAINGVGGRSLNDEWNGAARAYLGITVAGFPNLFLMYGPNTNLGHNSIIFMIECQANYILGCLEEMDSHGLASIEL
ncbi:MAG: hypothetical protein QOK03_2893, partial [Candidatus Binataceae bacterium]|nr:hypothetical protein [Candidatus Binataceae bacterium]